MSEENPGWEKKVADSLQGLLPSVTASAKHYPELPDLNNEQFRSLVLDSGKYARQLDKYVRYSPVIYYSHASAKTLSALILEHPIAANHVFSVAKKCSAIGVQTIKKSKKPLGFVQYLISNFIYSSILRGTEETARSLNKVLESTDGRENLDALRVVFLPGIDIKDRYDITDTLSIAPYEYFDDQLAFSAKSWYAPYNTNAVLIERFPWDKAIICPASESQKRGYHLLPEQQDAMSALALLSIKLERPVYTAGSTTRAEKSVYDVLGWEMDMGILYYGATGRNIRFDDDRRVVVDETILHGVRKLMSQRAQLSRDDIQSIDISVRRLSSYYGRGSSKIATEDRFLDVAIALEALYRPNGSKLREKISSRAAWFFGKNETDRLEIKDTVKKFYEYRSAIVHGTHPDNDNVALGTVFDIAKKTLMTHLEKGKFPSDEEWNRLTLGCE